MRSWLINNLYWWYLSLIERVCRLGWKMQNNDDARFVAGTFRKTYSPGVENWFCFATTHLSEGPEMLVHGVALRHQTSTLTVITFNAETRVGVWRTGSSISSIELWKCHVSNNANVSNPIIRCNCWCSPACVLPSLCVNKIPSFVSLKLNFCNLTCIHAHNNNNTDLRILQKGTEGSTN